MAVHPVVDLEHHIAERQRNVDPLASALNQGRFYGMLARGTRLNGLQRLGAIVVAIELLVAPAFLLSIPYYPLSLKVANTIPLVFWVFIGTVILMHALLPNPPLPPDEDELLENTTSPE